MFIYDLKRMISWKWMAVSGLVMTALTFAVKMDAIAEILRQNQFLPVGWCAQFLKEAWLGKAFTFCVPILCALPGAASFVDEYQTNMCRMALGRTSRDKYLKSKVCSVAFSGGITVIAGLVVSALVTWVLFHPLVSAELSVGGMVSMETEWISFVVVILIRFAVFGALGAVTGLVISAAVNNRYMAWLSPFMGEYLLIILCDRYWKKALLLSPAEWLNPGEEWPLYGYGSILWMICLCALFMCAFYRIGKGRLEEL